MAISAKQQQLYREHLQQEHERIEAELAGLDDEMVDLGISQQNEGGGASNHIADDATDVTEQQRNLAMVAGLNERQREVAQALERLDKGTYGICGRCGQPIAPERLEVLPFVMYCITCQVLEDRANS